MGDPFSLGPYRSDSQKPEDFLSFVNSEGARGPSALNDANSSENKALGFGLQAIAVVAFFLIISIPLAVFVVGGYLLYWAWEKKEDRLLRALVTFLILVLSLHTLQDPVLQALRDALREVPKIYPWFERGIQAAYQTPYEWLIPGALRHYIPPEDFLPFLLALLAIPGARLIGSFHQHRSRELWVRLFLSRRYYAFLKKLGLGVTYPFSALIRWTQSIHWAATLLAIVLIGSGMQLAYDKLLPLIATATLPSFAWPFLGLFHWPFFLVIGYRILRDLSAPSLGLEDPLKYKFQKAAEVPWVKVGYDSLGAEVGFTLPELQHHVHVVGQSGSGKSVFLRNLYEHHIRYGLGFAFIDLKADWNTVEELLALANKYNRLPDLQILHLSEPELSLPYNVLARGNATELKDKLIGALDWSEIHYKKLAERVLLTLCRGLVLVRDEKEQIITLADLHRCLASESAIRILANEVPTKHAEVRSDLFELAKEFSVRANQERIEGLRTDLEVMVKSEFGRLLTSPEAGIDLSEIIEQGKIFYVLLDSQRFGESSRRLGKLLLSDLKVASGRLISSDVQAHHFGVIVDEFSELATEDFIGFLNKARGSKIAVTIAHQELSDLQRFSDTLRDQIFGCTQTTVAFLQKNPMSAEVLASMVGTTPGKEITKQTTDGLLFRGYTGTGSEKTVEQFRMHPNEFKNLNVGQAIVIRKNPPRNAKIEVSFLEIVKEPVTEKMRLAINQVPEEKRLPFDLRKKERFEREPKREKPKERPAEKGNSKMTLSDWKVDE